MPVQHPLLVALYLAQILNVGPGTLPFDEPCEIRALNPYEWQAFAWSPQHQLLRIERYTSGTLRERTVLSWNGTTLTHIDDDLDGSGNADNRFTFTWANGLPARVVRETVPGGSVQSGRTDWTWTWSADHRTARIAEHYGSGAPTIRTARFDASGRLLTLQGDGDDIMFAELQWSTEGRLVSQRTHYSAYQFAYDDHGRIATRTATSPGGETERYVYQCPAR